MSDLPKGWAWTTLGEIADVRLGRQRSPKNHTGVRMRPYIRAANVTWTGLDLSDVKEMNFTEAESATYELHPGDVLIAEASGSASEVGKPAIWRGEIEGCCFQNTLIRVRARHASPEFLRYYVLAEARSGRIGNSAPGVGIHHIGSARLTAWPLPLPPLSEQPRIVAAIEEHLSSLDAADASLLRAQSRIDAVRACVITALVERPHWPRTPWKVVGRSQNGRAFPSKDYSVNGIRLLRPGNLHQSGRVEWTEKNTRLLPESYATEHPRFIVGENELVMNLTAQSLKDEFLGRVCLTGAGERCLLNQRIARLTPADVDPQFIMYAFKTQRFRSFVGSLNTGSLIQHMFTLQLDDYELPMPPINDQRRIVAEIEERLSVIDVLRSSIERAQRRSASLRRAILERAFRGELVPQDPSDEPASVLLERIRAEREVSKTASGRRRAPVRR